MNGLHDLTTIDRIRRVRDEFATLGCAQLHDAAPRLVHVLGISLLSRTRARRLAGPVFPVVTDNDMLPCLQGLHGAPPGAVLLIQNCAERSEALAGDIFVTAAREQGLGGVAVLGAIRDIDFIADFNFPVFSREVTYVSAKTAEIPASVPTSIELANVIIEPNDWLFADSDGAAVIKRRHLSAVINGAIILRQREQSLIEALRDRRLGDICGLEDFLAGRGKLKSTV